MTVLAFNKMIISHFLFSVERFPSLGNLNELREFAYKKYPKGPSSNYNF